MNCFQQLKKAMRLIALSLSILAICSLVTTVAKAEPENTTAQSSPNKSKRVVWLLIGIEDYKYLPRLRSPISNIEVMTNALKIVNAEYTVMTNAEATKVNIMKKIQYYQKQLSEQDVLVIYYSGHGGQAAINLQAKYRPSSIGRSTEENTYHETIMPVDASYNTDTQLSSSELTDLLKNFSSERITLIVDCSYSRLLLQSVAPSFQSLTTVHRSVSSIRFVNTVGTNVMYASDWNEPAWDENIAGKPTGLFTYYLGQGITLKVADTNRDEAITALELFEYARNQTVHRIGYQHPQYYKGRFWDETLILLPKVQ